ncbi:MAG: biotin [Geobacteraceae bacterium]|nr:MAG: biotin [Geobacteraceae bacterium]
MRKIIDAIADRIIDGGAITEAEALTIAEISGSDIFALFTAASRIKEHFVGDKVFLCSIINAKSGRCPENCSFCAQSAHHKTNAPVYPLVDEERMFSCAHEAEKNGSSCYGIITSGTSIRKGEELDRICRAVRRIRSETEITPSCSLGIIDLETATVLKEAGVETYHHNLETARSFFSHVCTTHDYEEDVETVRVTKQAGLKVCCGGIFGLGESAGQRVEMAMTLRELDVDSVPLNFLNPIEGTRLAGTSNITPMECLRTIALYRLILPAKRISICGGREKNLRDLQSWIFFAGASGTMIGNYLTTTGRPPEQDWQMLTDLGLTVASCCEKR